jgi:hypothetical protein
MPRPGNRPHHFAINRILIGTLILYVCAFAVLLRNKSFDTSSAVVVLIVFGIVFPLIAWIATRRAIPLSISITPGKSQLDTLLSCRFTWSAVRNGSISIFLPRGSIPRGPGFLSRSQRNLSFSSLFLSRSSDSVSVIGFAISEFNARVYERFAAVIYPLSLL